MRQVHEGRGQTQRSGWQASKRTKAKRAAALRGGLPSRRVSDARSEQSSEARVSGGVSIAVCPACPGRRIACHRRGRFAGSRPRSARWQESRECREALRLTAAGKALKAREA